jgi:hypothetical protein
VNQELIDLAIERGRLIERISNQRQLLGQQLQPIGDTLHATDRVVATVRSGCLYVRQHPHVVTAARRRAGRAASSAGLALDNTRSFRVAHLAPAAQANGRPRSGTRPPITDKRSRSEHIALMRSTGALPARQGTHRQTPSA